MNYAIHKSLEYSIEDIENAINSDLDLPSCSIQIWQDGWIIAEPEGMAPDDWSRNRDDYNITSYPPL